MNFSPESIPYFFVVRQNLDNAPAIESIEEVLIPQLRGISPDLNFKDRSVTLAVGSRDIDRISLVVKPAVDWITEMGGKAKIIPAEGSHGEGTPEGQKEELAKLGVTESSMGCPIDASMKTLSLGRTKHGVEVFFSESAYFADYVVPIGRVNPHTSFSGPVESGLTKLMTVGLGKIEGACEYHAFGYPDFSRNLTEALQVIQGKVNVPLGIALVENGLSKLTTAKVLAGSEINEWDRKLLIKARSLMPSLPGDKIDLLIVDEIGKKFSGRGMNTKVINRDYDGPLPFRPEISQIIVRNVLDGNANGIGAADVVLLQAADAIDWDKTNLNAKTAGTPEGARLSLVAQNDLLAFKLAFLNLEIFPGDACIAYIKNTKYIADMLVSAPYFDQFPPDKTLVSGDPFKIEFDNYGMLSKTSSSLINAML